MPGAPSSVPLLLVAMPGAPSSVLAPSSKQLTVFRDLCTIRASDRSKGVVKTKIQALDAFWEVDLARSSEELLVFRIHQP